MSRVKAKYNSPIEFRKLNVVLKQGDIVSSIHYTERTCRLLNVITRSKHGNT